MDSVLQRQQQRGYAPTTTVPSSGVTERSVTDVSQCETPIHGTLDGQGVRIMALGNVTGFSPGFLCVDETGYPAWVPLAAVRITDPNFLPIRLGQAL